MEGLVEAAHYGLILIREWWCWEEEVPVVFL